MRRGILRAAEFSESITHTHTNTVKWVNVQWVYFRNMCRCTFIALPDNFYSFLSAVVITCSCLVTYWVSTLCDVWCHIDWYFKTQSYRSIRETYFSILFFQRNKRYFLSLGDLPLKPACIVYSGSYLCYYYQNQWVYHWSLHLTGHWIRILNLCLTGEPRPSL